MKDLVVIDSWNKQKRDGYKPVGGRRGYYY